MFMTGSEESSGERSAIMLKAIYFVQKKGAERGRAAAVNREMERAAGALRDAGFGSGVCSGELPPPEAAGHLLFLCDSGELLRRMRRDGYYAVGYSHAGNAGENFSGASYVVQEPDLVDPDSYVKMYEREAGIPWTILETPRCAVREFTTEDLEPLYLLYDEEAGRYLQPPSEDRAREREILRAYIERIYRLYGFGNWAVTAKDRSLGVPPGTLIGRIGFAALTTEQEREALRLGIRAGIPAGHRSEHAYGPAESPQDAASGTGDCISAAALKEDGPDDPAAAEGTGIDADFGFLVAASCRRRGVAEEVCRALLQYGFEELGFTRIRADAQTGNTASLQLLEKLGFICAGTVRDGCGGTDARKVFILESVSRGQSL